MASDRTPIKRPPLDAGMANRFKERGRAWMVRAFTVRGAPRRSNPMGIVRR